LRIAQNAKSLDNEGETEHDLMVVVEEDSGELGLAIRITWMVGHQRDGGGDNEGTTHAYHLVDVVASRLQALRGSHVR
jgi:hypothetical protein